MTTASEPINPPTHPTLAPASPAPTVAPPELTAPELVLEPAQPPTEWVAAEPEPKPEPTEPEPASDADAEPADEKWTHPEGWQYDWLPYRGDLLAVRIPTRAAIHAMSNLRHSSDTFKDELAFRFLGNHLTTESYERINNRMVDPDDTEYNDCPDDTTPLFEVMGELMKLGNERLEAAAKALAEVTS